LGRGTDAGASAGRSLGSGICLLSQGSISPFGFKQVTGSTGQQSLPFIYSPSSSAAKRLSRFSNPLTSYSNHERGRSVRCSGTLFIDHVTVTLPHCHTMREGKETVLPSSSFNRSASVLACAAPVARNSAAIPVRSSFFIFLLRTAPAVLFREHGVAVFAVCGAQVPNFRHRKGADRC